MRTSTMVYTKPSGGGGRPGGMKKSSSMERVGSSLVLHQFQKMTGQKACNKRFEGMFSWQLALSGLAFAIGALIGAMTSVVGFRWHTVMWFVISVSSCCADGFFRHVHTIDVLDCYIAAAGMLYTVTKPFHTEYCATACGWVTYSGVAIALVCLHKSREAQKWEQFVFWHSMWHYVAGFFVFLLDYSAVVV